ncbi:MAG: PIN domain-containing protein, partial [Anaerolineales bacterium]|nr:PIN domain-containing protein [Anaerolineales bacterium]
MPETKAHFIDTNIWLYSLLDTGEAEKTEAAQALIKSSEAIVSPQVISEVCANLVKKAKMPEEEIRKFIEGIYAKHRVTEYYMRVFLAASELREEYSLS